ncbi:hypothetical protein D3C85_626950 [compost metagenome]
MRSLISNPNVDNSDPANYPSGRIKDNSGIGDGTAVNERTKGDLHQMVERLMILAGITPNNLPDNVTNDYQIIDALIALASKNDYILDLTTTGGVLQIPVKVALMKEGESLVCLASANKTTETTIKGSDNSVTAVTFSGNFKANEYVRFIKTASGVTLVRIGDNASLNAMVSELFFLKKANYAQELAGALDTVATTPQTNALVFTERVNGASSSVSLANASRNGLLSKEFWSIINGLGSILPRNTGWFSGVNIDSGSVGATYARSGNITSATIQTSSGGRQVIRCVMANAMDNLNYVVDTEIESQGTYTNDVEIQREIFRPITENSFDIAIRETSGVSQSLKIHVKVFQLS